MCRDLEKIPQLLTINDMIIILLDSGVNRCVIEIIIPCPHSLDEDLHVRHRQGRNLCTIGTMYNVIGSLRDQL